MSYETVITIIVTIDIALNIMLLDKLRKAGL